MEIKKRVIQLIGRFHTNDPFVIAKALNIVVIKEPLGKVRGYYHYFKRNRFIHIHSELCSEEQRMVCAHELGHALLHPKVNAVFIENYTFYVGNKFERDANRFAAELLLPDDLFKRYPGYSMEEIAAMEGVHENLVKLKCNAY